MLVSVATRIQKIYRRCIYRRYNKGIYKSDGRSSKKPTINYGTEGMLHGKKYMVTTSWNAPKEAFTLPDEFFGETSVDNGPLFGFHRMNAFTGMTSLKSLHFHARY